MHSSYTLMTARLLTTLCAGLCLLVPFGAAQSSFDNSNATGGGGDDPWPVPTMYYRNRYVVKKSFAKRFWWIGFIAILIVFVLIVVALWVLTYCHFRESEQAKRRYEIEQNDDLSDEEGNSSSGASVSMRYYENPLAG